ncbi:MAG: hypothetical protein IH943_04430 [Acidobacteria bacterium]|nr:hypothetical protein [Acidobacteriota bacterium]
MTYPAVVFALTATTTPVALVTASAGDSTNVVVVEDDVEDEVDGGSVVTTVVSGVGTVVMGVSVASPPLAVPEHAAVKRATATTMESDLMRGPLWHAPRSRAALR